jgi:hypothetical protein
MHQISKEKRVQTRKSRQLFQPSSTCLILFLCLVTWQCKTQPDQGQDSHSLGLGAKVASGIDELGTLPSPPARDAATLGALKTSLVTNLSARKAFQRSPRESFSAVLLETLIKIDGLPKPQLKEILTDILSRDACGGLSCAAAFGLDPKNLDRFLDDQFLKIATHPMSREPDRVDQTKALLSSLGSTWEERAARWHLTTPQEKAYVRDYIDPFLGKIPNGFRPAGNGLTPAEAAKQEYNSYMAFAQTMRNRINELDPDAEVLFQGSSVSGYRFPRPTDPEKQVKFRKTSDYDTAICSEKLYSQAKQLKIPMRSTNGLRARTPPLNGKYDARTNFDSESALRQLGLSDLRQTLEAMAGREISFMIYKSCGGAIGAYPSIIVPR